jgi:hypothetical protein
MLTHLLKLLATSDAFTVDITATDGTIYSRRGVHSVDAIGIAFDGTPAEAHDATLSHCLPWSAIAAIQIEEC